MKTRIKKWRSKYWDARAAREKRFIASSAAIVLPLLYFFLLWQPAHRAVPKLLDTVPTLKAESVRLSIQAAEIAELQHRPQLAAFDATSLKSTLEESAQRHRIESLSVSLDAQDTNSVRVNCASMAFAAWIAWLRELEQEQHIRATSVSVSALPQSGMVKINALLTNSYAQ